MGGGGGGVRFEVKVYMSRVGGRRECRWVRGRSGCGTVWVWGQCRGSVGVGAVGAVWVRAVGGGAVWVWGQCVQGGVCSCVGVGVGVGVCLMLMLLDRFAGI